MVKAYGGMVIIAEMLVLLLKFVYYSLECLYRLFVPVEEKSVAGEIVLVTGAGHGIGRQLALRYASLGATVVCWDLNPQSNDVTVNEIKKMGAVQAFGYKCDVSSREEVLRVAEKVRQEVGHVSILVNNAGIMPVRPFLEHKPEEIRRIFDINLLAHCWTLEAFLPQMIERNHGHVVALSSMAGIIGLRNLVPYCASKFAVRGLMEALGEELHALGQEKVNNVHLTTIHPYMVDTGLCKNPKIRFPSIMSLIPAEDAVSEIVKAQRRNMRMISIPGHWLPTHHVFRCFPTKFTQAFVKFVGSGVEPDS